MTWGWDLNYPSISISSLMSSWENLVWSLYRDPIIVFSKTWIFTLICSWSRCPIFFLSKAQHMTPTMAGYFFNGKDFEMIDEEWSSRSFGGMHARRFHFLSLFVRELHTTSGIQQRTNYLFIHFVYDGEATKEETRRRPTGQKHIASALAVWFYAREIWLVFISAVA